MTTLLFSNDAESTLATAIGPGDTTITLAAGTGNLFPQPAAGQGFVLTLSAAGGGPLFEIVLVTSVASDLLTVTRAQEGTTAQSWAIGDAASHNYTAGTARAFLQIAPGTPGFIPAPTTAGTHLGWNGTSFVWVPD